MLGRATLILICVAYAVAVVSIPDANTLQQNSSTSGGKDDLLMEEETSTLLEEPSNLLEKPSNISEKRLPEPPAADSVLNTDRNANHSLTYDGLYEEGVKHYLEEEWTQCAGYMEMAIKDYHWYTGTLTRCRRDCKGEAESATPLLTPRTIEQEFFETSIRNALCLLKCRNHHFSSRKHHIAPQAVDKDFEIRKPYDYLQLCHYKMGRFQDAADAAVTVLARQPDHSIMANNLRQYIDDYSADPDLLQNLELQEYAIEYVAGDRAHAEEDYAKSILHMEAALSLYWRTLEDCRLKCEEPFDQGWFPDFISSISNHYTFTFRCKRLCPAKLSNLYGEEIADFLPSIFNYLQFGYQKQNNIPAACAATENYLELLPADASMIKNKQFYLSEYQKMDRFFVASKDVVAHASRERYEDALLHFIDTEFVFLEDDKRIQLAEEHKENRTRSLRETLTDMLSSVFTAKPVLEEYSKGEL